MQTAQRLSTCPVVMRLRVQFQYDAPFPSPQKPKYFKPDAVWWHMPTTPALGRERQVDSKLKVKTTTDFTI